MLHKPGTLIIVPWEKYFLRLAVKRRAALRRGFDERLSLPATRQRLVMARQTGALFHKFQTASRPDPHARARPRKPFHSIRSRLNQKTPPAVWVLTGPACSQNGRRWKITSAHQPGDVRLCSWHKREKHRQRGGADGLLAPKTLGKVGTAVQPCDLRLGSWAARRLPI